MKKVTVIGAGMGNSETMTIEGAAALSQASVLIGAKRLVAPFLQGNKQCYESFDPEEIAGIIQAHPGQEIAVLASGDTGFFSIAARLSEVLGREGVRLVPGISSVSYFAARLQKTYEDAHVMSLHGRQGCLGAYVGRYKKLFVLTDGQIGALCAELVEAGLTDCVVWVGENLSLPQERITKGTPGELMGTYSPLTLLYIENPAASKATAFGLEDGAFIRGGVPMTKSEVRSVIVSKLQVQPEDVLYDIGAGTGSVSVELAGLAYEGRVYAVEMKAEALDLIRQNRERFHRGNLIAVPGQAPGALGQLPPPDGVFIGGSTGNLRPILESVLAKNPQARIVISVTALETLSQALAVFQDLNLAAEVVQVAVARGVKRGSYTLMQANNPVTIITRRFEDGGAKVNQL